MKGTEEKPWRHLDFFRHQAYLTGRFPRVECPAHKVHLVAVPWARPRWGFALWFEALVMAMVRAGGEARGSGRRVGQTDLAIVHHYVDLAVDAQNLESVDRAGIDETSSRRGQNYVSVFADLGERRGVFVVEDAITGRCRRSRWSSRPTGRSRMRQLSRR